MAMVKGWIIWTRLIIDVLIEYPIDLRGAILNYLSSSYIKLGRQPAAKM